MGIRLIFRNHERGAVRGRRRVGQPVIGFRFKPVGGPRRKKTRGHSTPRGDDEGLRAEVIDPTLPRKSAGCVESLVTVPQTDSGGLVENTKAFGRTQVKELGKLTP